MTGSTHLNDVGTILERTVEDPVGTVVPLDLATTKEVIFELPDRTSVTKALVFKTDGKDGIIQYVFENGFLSQIGRWRFQLHFIFSSGDWKSDIEAFRVWPNLS